MTRPSIDDIARDIRRGENIDLYVAIAAALGLAILNLFGLVPERMLGPIAMAVLATLAYTLIGVKYQLTEVRSSQDQTRMSQPFATEFPPEFAERLEDASEVWLTGTHLSSFVTEYYATFERKLRRKGKLRFLLVDPRGAAAAYASKRFPGDAHPEQEIGRILASLTTLSKLKAKSPNLVEIKVIDFPIDSTTIYLSPSTNSAAIYAEHSTYKVSGGARKPKFVHKRSDGRWFEHIDAEVRALWQDGSKWTEPPSGHVSTSGPPPVQDGA